MDNNTRNINAQAQLWALTGPLLIACTFLIIAIRAASMPWGLPLVALVGLLICYQWHWRGVLISLCLLIGVLTYNLSIVPTTDWLWFITLAASIAAAFVVTALSLEESRYAWQLLHREAGEQKLSISHLSQQVEVSRKEIEDQHRLLSGQIDKLESHLNLSQEKISSAENLVFLARDELTKSHAHQQKLLQDLLETRQKAVTMEQRLEDQQASIDTVHAAKIAATEPLKRLIATRDSEIEELKISLEAILSEDRLVRQQLTSAEAQVTSLREHQKAESSSTSKLKEKDIQQQTTIQELNFHLDALSKEKTLLETNLEKLKRELDQLRANEKAHEGKYLQLLETHKIEIESLQMVVKSHKNDLVQLQQQWQRDKQQLVAEKESLAVQLQQVKEELQSLPPPSAQPAHSDTRELRRVEGLYNQLRNQFAQKSATLDSTRRELFHAQEQLTTAQKEMEETKLIHEREIESHLSKLLNSAERELSVEDRLQKEIDQLHEIIASLMPSS